MQRRRRPGVCWPRFSPLSPHYRRGAAGGDTTVARRPTGAKRASAVTAHLARPFSLPHRTQRAVGHVRVTSVAAPPSTLCSSCATLPACPRPRQVNAARGCRYAAIAARTFPTRARGAVRGPVTLACRWPCTNGHCRCDLHGATVGTFSTTPVIPWRSNRRQRARTERQGHLVVTAG